MTADYSIDVLKQLLGTVSPSGDEVAAASIWRNEATTFADHVYTDINGNTYAVLKGGSPRILLAGHIDEIGIMVNYINDEGYLFFSGVGGWDAQVLVGQRVRLLGRHGHVIGVIGKRPIHTLKATERDRASQIDDLWIDIGVQSRDEVTELVRVGCTGVIDADPYNLPNNRIVARGLDNRIGAFTVLEVIRKLAQQRPTATVAAVATCQEEITLAGAATAAFGFEPHMAIVVDVTHATDHPDTDKKRLGDIKLGGGPVIERGSANSTVLHTMLLDIAERLEIPYGVGISPRYTGTDADSIYLSRSGVATAVVSIPNRYMHSPNEMVDLKDVGQAIDLIAALILSITETTDFTPR
ncbi:MAG: M42 family peptidase [Chloroflexi bacterium AL-W]|nr:M42 family peptidase [Chloroflexi bacterium AL-N1]NOK65581.1 M42 family peptidase [Chloroflexi bacterium AL-N10]NOK74478.1 M42 family peptidase [Chloroflexi bacterium AL-N5]NOK80614.1 M42 family peptidase [Chloroflexi bacterium AL-W]NOK88736.1 M42 family peptidase [Chloroflexi bacterium AL-N15]